MKLRGNKLKPLRFDPSGVYNEGLGIRQSDVRQLALELGSIRDSLVSTNAEDSRDLAFCGTAFYGEPKRLLLEYEQDRHGSKLAQLFKVANRMHASVDRVVVIGVNGVHSGARTFLDGCCQPYWNELSRGDRGSKPRIYFDGNNLDNDATQGLLSLLGATEGRPSTSELDAWGLVVVGDGDQSIASLEPFMRALEVSCSGDLSKVHQRLIAVTGTDGALRRRVDEIGCPNIFPYPNFDSEQEGVGFTVFSPIGLVPAAILGVNVIELLLGAVAINDHFERATTEENIILQFVAVNHLLEAHPSVRSRVVSLQNQSLESLGTWYRQLQDQQLLKRGSRDQSFSGSTSHRLETPGLRPLESSVRGFSRLQLIHSFIVEECRFDLLRVVEQDSESKLGVEITQSRQLSGVPTTNLYIPRVDELHLGQLLQMLMIATTIERRLADAK